MKNHSVLIAFVLAGVLDVAFASIWSRTLLHTDGHLVERLPIGQDFLKNVREKRATGKLTVDKTTLQDKNHNEAIVHWSGNKSDVMFVLTREHFRNGSVPSSRLYRSEDYGSTFNPLVPGKDVDVLLRYYYSSVINRNKLIFTDFVNKTLYTTSNEGRNFTKRPISFAPGHLMFHPTNENTVLAYDFEARELFISTDFAQNWTKVSSYVNPRFFWADNYDDKKDMVHIEMQDPSTGKYQYQICGIDSCKPAFGQELSKDIDINSLVVNKEYVFVQQSTQHSSTLFVSWRRHPFKPAYFPLDIHPQDFNIINADEHQVFIAADTSEKTVNLYLSDETGQFYVESLNNLVVLRMPEGNFEADLYEVQGMKGVYIANIQHMTEGAKSQISFDQGGKWQPLNPPATDIGGNPKPCNAPDCGLHIHLSYSANYGIRPPLSEKKAPGIIMAHGTVGKGLSRNDVTMFMSNDTGVTWQIIFDGNHLYNIIDQGGAMVAVPQMRSTEGSNKIKYTCTEGKSWKEYTFSGSTVQVEGVLNEPGINTRIVSIYGHLDKDSAWMIVKVDFSSILTRECDDKSDYYNWKPLDKIKGNKCILGRELTFRRRKPDATCYNGEDYEHAQNNVTCACTDDDYECDFGYKKGGSGCLPHDWFNPNLPPFDCPEGTFYNKSNGFRKIAADECKGSSDQKYSTVNTSCPVTQPDDLSINTVDSRTVGVGVQVTLNLLQKRGSKKSTKYSWNFGDSDALTNATGFEKGKQVNHTYSERGMYTIKVTATNTKGSARTTAYLHVEDVIKSVYIDEPHGARAQSPVQFEAWPLAMSWSPSSQREVHFIWIFGDEEHTNEKPLLTYSQYVNHSYEHPGNYSVVVQAINSVGSAFRKIELAVYGSLKTVQLSFNEVADRLNKNTALWRKQFGDELKEIIAEEIDVMQQRLEVVVLHGFPTRADVSILPMRQDSTDDPTIDIILNRILSKVKDKTLGIDVGNKDFGDGRINVTKAVVQSEEPDSNSHPKNLVAVFVCVPILMLGIFVSFLVVLYYRRKFSHVRRYAMLQQSDAEDRLLGEDDAMDDDVPPLDLNPDRGLGGRLAMDDDDDDRSDLFQPG